VSNLLNQSIRLKYVDEADKAHAREITCRLDEQSTTQLRATLSKLTVDASLLTRLAESEGGKVDKSASIDEALKAKLGLRISVGGEEDDDNLSVTNKTQYAPIHFRQRTTDNENNNNNNNNYYLCNKNVVFRAPLLIQANLHDSSDIADSNSTLRTLFLRARLEHPDLLADQPELSFSIRLVNRLSFKIVNNKHTWPLKVASFFFLSLSSHRCRILFSLSQNFQSEHRN
jgi:hypothetical protein